MKKSNVILIVLSVLVLCVSVFIIMTYKGSEGSTSTLLKDMGSDELRVVGDKTDINSDYNKDSFVIKGEKPSGYMEPEDLEEQVKNDKNSNNSNGSIGNGNTQNNQGNTSEDRYTTIRDDSVFVGNPNRSELKVYEPGEYSNVLEEVVVPEKVVEKKTRITYNEAIAALRNSMNQDDPQISGGFNLTSYSYQFELLQDIADGKGVVIIPFNTSNEAQLKNVKTWIPIYEKYKNDIAFVFLNTELEYYGFRDMETVFAKYGISPELPIYATEFGEINDYVAVDGKLANQGYIILDRAFYVVDSGTVSDKTPTFSSLFTVLESRDVEYQKLEDIVTEKYDLGWIIKYADVQKAIDGTLTAPEGENQVETETEEIETE